MFCTLGTPSTGSLSCEVEKLLGFAIRPMEIHPVEAASLSMEKDIVKLLTAILLSVKERVEASRV